MNFKIKLFAWLILFYAAGCSAPKLVTSDKTKAELAAEKGNFVQATAAWKSYFERADMETVSGLDFARAAEAAYKSGTPDLATDWYDQARYKNYASPEMYLTLAEIYRSKNNLSKELWALEYIAQNFDENSGEIHERLFALYSGVNMPDKALQAWNKMDESGKSKTDNLNAYFQLMKAAENKSVTDSIAGVLLQTQPKHVGALEWMATKFYWQGENRYQREMKQYEINRTRKQHRILVAELKLATADLKKSLSYFERLWEIEQKPEYAGYMANIHARFDEDDQAAYYRSFTK